MALSFAASQSSKVRFVDITGVLIDTSNGSVCFLKSSSLIASVVERIFSSILKDNA